MAYTDKVLIVDDVAIMRSLLKRILNNYGYGAISEAASGDEALSLIDKLDYGMVMLDINMPGASGMQILKEIRKLDRPIFVVMVSSHSTMENVKRAVEIGANGFVVKPYNESKIGDILDKYRAWVEAPAETAETV